MLPFDVVDGCVFSIKSVWNVFFQEKMILGQDGGFRWSPKRILVLPAPDVSVLDDRIWTWKCENPKKEKISINYSR